MDEQAYQVVKEIYYVISEVVDKLPDSEQKLKLAYASGSAKTLLTVFTNPEALEADRDRRKKGNLLDKIGFGD